MSPSPSEPVTTTFLLVRHAESEANVGAYFGSQSDSKLSARGRRQVEAFTAALRHHPLSAVYSSDLSRAVDTVTPLARLRGLTVVTTPRLRERAMGVLTGLSFEEAKKTHPELWGHLLARSADAAPPGGESHEALRQRVAALLDELVVKHRGGTVMLGSHGVAINHMLRHLMGVTDHAIPFWFAVDNASLSRVDVQERGGHPAPRLTYANRIVDGFGDPP